MNSPLRAFACACLFVLVVGTTGCVSLTWQEEVILEVEDLATGQPVVGAAVTFLQTDDLDGISPEDALRLSGLQLDPTDDDGRTRAYVRTVSEGLFPGVLFAGFPSVVETIWVAGVEREGNSEAVVIMPAASSAEPGAPLIVSSFENAMGEGQTVRVTVWFVRN